MGINIFGKFKNRQDGGKLMDYVDIDGAPILEQDLSANGIGLVANSYYKHTGAKGEYITGIVYYFDGNTLKPIDGSGALGEVTELETEQVEPGEIEIDSEPIKDSPNVITSGGTYNALEPLKISISATQEEVGKIPRITVDETLNATSTNPIANKAVNAAFVQVNNKIGEVENKITQTGDYVDTKSTQTITGTKVFNNIQVDDVLFKTEDGKGYNCHLTGNPTATPDSAAPLKIYLPKKKGTLDVEPIELLQEPQILNGATSYSAYFDNYVQIPLTEETNAFNKADGNLIFEISFSEKSANYPQHIVRRSLCSFADSPPSRIRSLLIAKEKIFFGEVELYGKFTYTAGSTQYPYGWLTLGCLVFDEPTYSFESNYEKIFQTIQKIANQQAWSDEDIAVQKTENLKQGTENRIVLHSIRVYER